MKKTPSKRKTVTAADVKKVALSFPEANEKPSYGKPSFFIAKKFFTPSAGRGRFHRVGRREASSNAT